jgi:hypothetical protein
MNRIIAAAIMYVSLGAAGSVLAETVIQSLPYNCDKAGETYVLANDLSSSSGNGISISANGVTLDGRGHTLRYAESGKGHGVELIRSVSSVEIRNIMFRQGAYDPSGGEKVSAIVANNNSSGIRILDNDIRVSHGGRVSGAYGFGIQLHNATSSRNNVISGNTILVTGSSGGRGISIDGDWTGEIYDNKITVDESSRNPAGYPRAISLISADGIAVAGNELVIGPGIDTGQGISLWGSSNNQISGNMVIMKGIQSRGILIDGASNENNVVDNTVLMQSSTGGDRYSAGIRIRYGSSRNTLERNLIDATAAGASFPLRLGGADASYPTQPKDNVIKNNRILAGSRTVYIEDGSDFLFIENEIEAKSGGYAVFLWCKPCSRNEFNFDTIIGRIHATGSGSNTSFCATSASISDTSSDEGNHSFNFRQTGCSANPTIRPKPPESLSAL